MDMCMDMCIDMCMDMRIDMCVDMCTPLSFVLLSDSAAASTSRVGEPPGVTYIELWAIELWAIELWPA